MDTTLLFVEALLVGALGLWMAVAVFDNWRHPRLNLDAVRMVVQFELMERDYPEDYAVVAHRRIDDPLVIKAMFALIRAAETLAAVALLSAALWLMGATAGMAAPGPATIAAILSTTFFVLIWAGFIIGGNYFHYYFCHQWGQSNHFMFMYWGLFVLLVLII